MKTNSNSVSASESNSNSGLLNRTAQLSGKRVTIDLAARRYNRALPTERVLRLLATQAPRFWEMAEVVGKWVWIRFDGKQPPQITAELAELGFHWNNRRQTWQHPCGQVLDRAAGTALIFPPIAKQPKRVCAMKEPSFLPGLEIVKPFTFSSQPYEYKVTALRECPTPEKLQMCDTPAKAADYWRLHIPAHPYFNPECECCVVLILNTRRRVKGHYLVATGTQDTLLIHPREVFRLAIMTSAASVVMAHNHPSGDPAPSEADIKVTRDLIRAGQLLKIELLDHIIMGNPKHSSLRELGYVS